MAAPTPDAFADAVARAKTLAAKFSGSTSMSPPAGIGIKRPAETDNGDATQAKRTNVNDKVAQAAEAAARVVQKLGGSSIPSMANGGATLDGSVSTVQITVPDKYVGLIIGKKGEQITAIQAESSCKVQVAQDSQGTSERAVTLMGTQEEIRRARRILDDIIDKANRGLIGNSTPAVGGQSIIELTIPGPKVGLVIGKNGETIKKLQEDSGVKMVMIQENNEPSFVDKQLRISGDQSKLEAARQMVLSLLASKDMGFPGATVARGGGGGGFTEVRVPRRAVGIVIGRGGDMLKKLSEETGCRVQFRQDGENDFELPERICQISGPPDACQVAARRVQELVDSTLQGNMGNRPGQYGAAPGSQTRTFAVPAEKAGLVIGKGGETVKDICRQTGAFIEIQKQPPPNPNIKVFNVSGSPAQIDHGIRLICERVGIPPPQGGPPMGGPGNPYASQYPDAYGQQPQQWGGHDPNSNYPTQYPGQAQPAQQPWNAQQGNWPGQQPGHPQTPGGGSGGAPGQTGMPAPQINPATGQPDYSQAWAEYYRRQGMHDYADAILRQAAQGGNATPQGAPNQQPQNSAQPQMQQPTQQPQQSGQMMPQPQAGVPNPTAAAVGQQSAQGNYDYQQWQQYQQQYQQWQQQYAGWQQQNAGGAPQPGVPGMQGQQPPTSMPGR